MVYKSWIRLVTRNVRKSCLMLQAKKPNPKLWSGSFCLLRAYDIEKMSSDYLVHQILFYKNSRLPSTNVTYWESKIKTNIERDERKILELEKLGYKVLTIWQCQLRASVRAYFLNRLIIDIKSGWSPRLP